MTDYTPKQYAYMDSVLSPHQSAIRIIGELESWRDGFVQKVSELLSSASIGLLDPETGDDASQIMRLRWLIGRMEQERDVFEQAAAAHLRRVGELENQRDKSDRAVELWTEAFDDVRDAVLYERYQLAEAGLDSDQVNAVLSVIDDCRAQADPGRGEGPTKCKHGFIVGDYCELCNEAANAEEGRGHD